MSADVVSSPTERTLSVDGLSVEFRIEGHWVPVLDNVCLEISRGEVLGLVGESGSGKSVTARAIMGLLPPAVSRVTSGRVVLGTSELLGLPERSLNSIRGKRMSMIFQEPIRSLNPAYTVGEQVAEVIREHTGATRRDAWDRAVSILETVEIPSAAERAHNYPHQFSGGMCQRVMLAIALACEPDLLIADEPTTALDVTIQAQVLRLLRGVQERTGVSILLITHDLGVVAGMCDRIAVMYAGQIVECGPICETFDRPRHPYLQGLLSSLPRLNTAARLDWIAGQVARPGDWPVGCRFHPRCDHAIAGRCDSGSIDMSDVGGWHVSRCVRASELELDGVASG